MFGANLGEDCVLKHVPELKAANNDLLTVSCQIYIAIAGTYPKISLAAEAPKNRLVNVSDVRGEIGLSSFAVVTIGGEKTSKTKGAMEMRVAKATRKAKRSICRSVNILKCLATALSIKVR